jgi:hypothetical protein
MKFDFWSFVINKSHVAVACIAQGWVMWENHHGHDISANVAQTLNWFYMFLAGHFGASQVWPDKPDQGQDAGSAGSAGAKG